MAFISGMKGLGVGEDLPGQWKDGITDRICSKGVLFKLLSWNNAVMLWGQHRLGLCTVRSRMQQAAGMGWDAYIQIWEIRSGLYHPP